MEKLTRFPSDDDYSSGHAYRSNYHQIDEYFQTLALGSRPQFRGAGDDPIITLEIVIILPMLLVGMILIDIQQLEHELVIPMDMINLLIAATLHIKVLDTISMMLRLNSLQGYIFLIMDHQVNHLIQHIQVMNNSFNHAHSHYANYRSNLYARYRTNDDDDFEPSCHSAWY